MRIQKVLYSTLIGLTMSHQAYAADIIHDGEFNYIQAQHKEAWDKQDKVIDAKLAEIQKRTAVNALIFSIFL